MAAANADDGRSPARVTSYTYDDAPLDPLATSWTVYDADGRVVERGTGTRPPDLGLDDGPPDEPHIVD